MLVKASASRPACMVFENFKVWTPVKSTEGVTQREGGAARGLVLAWDAPVHILHNGVVRVHVGAASVVAVGDAATVGEVLDTQVQTQFVVRTNVHVIADAHVDLPEERQASAGTCGLDANRIGGSVAVVAPRSPVVGNAVDVRFQAEAADRFAAM